VVPWFQLKRIAGTSYEIYLEVLDLVKKAYFEIYGERVGLTSEEYRALSGNTAAEKELMQNRGKEGIPMAISIAEPDKIRKLIMGKFNKKTKADTNIPTSALPDIIFMLLFFFMVTTVLREQDLLVEQKIPQATQLQKLQKKSLISYLYLGKPKNPALYGVRTEEYRRMMC
jgi:hypothetical protein